MWDTRKSKVKNDHKFGLSTQGMELSHLRWGRLQEGQVRRACQLGFGAASILNDIKAVMSSWQIDIRVWEEFINSGVISIERVFKVPTSAFWDTDSVTMYINLILSTYLTGSMMSLVLGFWNPTRLSFSHENTTC